MSVKATIDGEVWEFDSVADASEFKRSLTQQTATKPQSHARPRHRGRPPKAGRKGSGVKRKTTASSSNGNFLSKGSRQILDAVRRMPPAGLQSEEFATAIGSPAPTSV